MALPSFLKPSSSSPVKQVTPAPTSGAPSLQHDVGQLFGHALNALPGYSTLGANITNPNVNYKGIANPGKAPTQTAQINPASAGQEMAGATIQGGGNSGATSAADAAGQSMYSNSETMADHTAHLGSLRSDIANFVNQLTGMYHDISGKIDGAAADAANTTVKNYGDQENQANQQFNDQMPGLNFGYYANGIGDSSYRGTAVDGATKALQGSVNTIENNKQADLQKIDQTAQAKKAGYNADAGNLTVAQQNAAIDDSESNLQGTKANLATKLSGLQADLPNYQSGAQFSQDLANIAPTKDIAPVLDTLKTVMQGQAAQPVKAQIAGQILNNSNLAEADKKKIKDQYGLA